MKYPLNIFFELTPVFKLVLIRLYRFRNIFFEHTRGEYVVFVFEHALVFVLIFAERFAERFTF